MKGCEQMATRNDAQIATGSLIASPQIQLAVTTQNIELVPIKPEGLDDSQATQLQTEAQEIVDMYTQSPTDLHIAATIGQIGSVSSFEATRKTQLMGAKLKPLLTATAGDGGAIPNGLAEMRSKIDQINPAKIQSQLNQGWVGAALAKVYSPMKRILTNIAIQYDSVEDTINAIVNGLLLAKNGLAADNIEIATMVSEVEDCLANIRNDAYQSELVFEGVSKLPIPTNQIAIRARDTITRRLISRIQDLRTMETVLLQLSLEARSIFSDNDDLADAIDRSATITRALLTIGLVNVIALQKQKRTVGVIKDQRKYNNELVQSLAQAAGMGAIEVAKLMEDPALTYEGLSKAYGTLTTALDQADAIKRRRVTSALQVLPKLREMSSNLQERGERLSAGNKELGTGSTT
jgi:uncharacterized protein YaaN involved in tellurite resistance